MKKQKQSEDKGNRNPDLRNAAEDKLERYSDSALDLKGKTPETLIHELQVHQIELEMQNEELRRTQTELEASRARYFDLYNLSPLAMSPSVKRGLSWRPISPLQVCWL